MLKIILSLALITSLFLSGCTSCNTNKDKPDTDTDKKINEKKVEKKQLIKNSEVNVKPLNNTVSKQIDEPFNPTLEANISQDEIMTESLEQLEAEAFKAMQPKIEEEMQQIPDCLEKAESKEEAFTCSKNLRLLNKEIAMAMGDFDENDVEGYRDEFVWNEETKQDMIKEIESSMQSIQEMQSCLEISKTPEELKKCFNLK